jgi:hypothetical protein
MHLELRRCELFGIHISKEGAKLNAEDGVGEYQPQGLNTLSIG